MLHLKDLRRAQAGHQPSKLRNERTTTAAGAFDSQMEEARYRELLLLERVGEIRRLQRQVRFQLAPAVRFSDRPRQTPAMVYVADYVYEERRPPRAEDPFDPLMVAQEGPDCVTLIWARVVEDCKGMRTAMFQAKRHLMLALLGIEVRLSKPR